jgi:hypothetical protein
MKETKLKLPIYLSWSAPLPRRARPCSRGRALFNCKGLFQKFAHRGRAPSQESAPHLRRARPSSRGRALFNCKGLFQKEICSQGARSFSGERAPAQGSAPLLMRARPSCPGGSSRIDQAKIRHSFALKMNVGAGTQFVHR